MNNEVEKVQLLYDDAKDLYDNVVCGKADTIIHTLEKSIATLKNCWKGKDAGVQINNIIDVYNGMIKVRNALAVLAKDSSVVAVKYREVQNTNRANLADLSPLNTSEEKQLMENHNDDRDTVSITNEALNAKAELDSVNNQYEDLKSAINMAYDKIMDNWQAGVGRDTAQSAFSEFIQKSNKYKETLEEASQSISDAIRNYQSL